jgi:hypothetical protein
MRFLSVVFILPALTLAADPPIPPEHAAEMAAGRELFTRSVRETLVKACLKCHGESKTRGGLDLITRESLLQGGDNGPAITPRKAATSRLYRLAARLEEPHMPPKGHDPLTKQQLTDLAKWIDLGAPYDKPLLERAAPKPKEMVVTAEDRAFWSFKPLLKPSVPMPRDASWAINPIDRFLRVAQEAKRVTPAAPADRRTLLRRLKFGLVGLPPTPEEIDAFESDTRPDAYQRLVEHYLADPAHGERWARHWLDIVRFAESHGFEHDYDRPHAWPYRDFVVKALNADLPYHMFIRWQIAGDEYEPNNPLARTATGFLGAGVHSTQITAATVEKERYDELDDIVRTMGTAFLGLTIGCARCHDHKYDPVPMKDYYRLVSTFTKTVRSDQEIDLDPEAAQRARVQHEAELKRLDAELAQLEAGPVTQRLRAWRTKAEPLSPWTTVAATVKSAGKAVLTPQADGSFLASGPNPAKDVYVFTFKAPVEIASLRLEALTHPSMVRGGPGRASNGNFALSDVTLAADGKPVKLTAARATFEQKGLPVAATIDADPVSAWAVDPQFGKDQAAVWDLERRVPAGASLTLTLRFNNNTGHNIGRPRLSVSAVEKPAASTGSGLPDAVRAALAGQTEADEKTILSWYRTQDAEWKAMHAKREALAAQGPKVGKVKAMVCGEGLPPIRLHSQGGDFLEHTHFLNRGDPNQKGEIALPGFAQILTRGDESRWRESPPPGAKTPYHRRSLANWLTDAEAGAGHLLARVIVNRLWYHHFGRGIVATPSDFGLQGERPTHPELLDWLAGELIDSGWSLKHVHRLMVTSAAYRQGNTLTDANQLADPSNTLVWRQAPRRLEAEVIRDSLLAVAGTLDRQMGGPGARNADMPRRSLYFFLKRSQMNPMMMIFDAPDGTVGIEGRTTTTIAPQALLLMNNPQVRQAARAFAAQLDGLPDEQAIDRAYRLAVGRSPTPAEAGVMRTFLTSGSPRPREELCQVLLGLNEFIYID